MYKCSGDNLRSLARLCRNIELIRRSLGFEVKQYEKFRILVLNSQNFPYFASLLFFLLEKIIFFLFDFASLVVIAVCII